VTDRFLSEDDLDLRELTEEELYAWWNEWLRMAQATNEQDEHLHITRGVRPRPPRHPHP
jgi:hypothetical protein